MLNAPPANKQNNTGFIGTRKPTCALALDVNLEELKRLNGLESLREYIVKEKCFPPHVSAQSNAPITIDELKKLARAWKLNERRNFWKTHTTQDQLVEVLRKHIQDNIAPNQSKPTPEPLPQITTLQKPVDHHSSPRKKVAGFKPQFLAKKGVLRFYCGHKVQTKIRHTDDIITRSRFFAFPGDDNRLDSMIQNWRSEDFSQDRSVVDTEADLPAESMSMTSSKLETKMEETKVAMISKQKMEKQRALSVHLLTFSASGNFTGSSVNRKAVETFLDVGDSTDTDTVINAALAISNISSSKSVRNLLIELNAIHRYSGFLSHLTTPNAAMGCGLFFYYMSCDPENEDRVCSAGFKAFQRNAISEDFQLRIITLQCLSNLMPCSERLRVAELVVTTLHHMYRDFLDQTWSTEVFRVLLNVTCFTNTLRALVDADIMDIISVAAAEVHDDLSHGRMLAQIMSHFLYQMDLAEELVQADYSRIFIDLLGLEDPEITNMCMHAFAVMSASDNYVSSICDSDILHIVCSFVASSEDLPKQTVEDIARYLCNVCQPTLKGIEQRVTDGAAHALLELFRLSPDPTVQYFAILGLRDLLTSKANCATLFEVITPSLLDMLKTSTGSLDVNVVQCVNNICCAPQCHDKLIEHGIDMEILSILRHVYIHESAVVIGAFVRVLILMADMECVVERLVNDNIFQFLLQLVEYTYDKNAPANSKDIWIDISRLLLAIITIQPVLSEEHQDQVVKILPKIGTKGASEEIIADCAIVLAFLSYSISDFSTVDPIIRSILHISESDAVMEAASTVLYNVACSEDDAKMLLADGMLHINIMIRMMRNGSARVQQNVAEAMRLLCIKPRCNELLLKNDLLSDFIVIALLRTNSTSVKKVCSEAFFNMLCHNATRTKLLQGDLWWAMMRLSKTEIESVRMVCARAVFNLASDPHNIRALRSNYILSFVKEIAYDGSSDYLDIFLIVINNIMIHAERDSEESLNHTEIVAIIQILIKSISKSQSLVTSQWIGYLLSRTAELSIDGAELNEFIHMDVTMEMKSSAASWSVDMECRRHFSSMLCVLCMQHAFTTATPFQEVLPIVTLLVSHQQTISTDSGQTVQALPLDTTICENVCSVVLSYCTRGQIEPQQVVFLPFYSPVMLLSLTGMSPFMLQAIQRQGSYVGNRNNVDLDMAVSKLSVIFLRLIVFTLPTMCDTVSSTNTRKSKDGRILDVVSSIPVKGLLNSQLFLDSRTRDNVIHTIHALCTIEKVAEKFISSGIFEFLSTLLLNDTLRNTTSFIEFCSVIARNLASFTSLIPRIVKASSIDEFLGHIARFQVDASKLSVRKQQQLEALRVERLADVVALLLRVSHSKLSSEDPISPQSVLALVSDITESTDDVSIGHVTKLIIGLILDKTEDKTSFDPSYVRAILSEINAEDAYDSTKEQQFLQPKQLAAVKVDISLVPVEHRGRKTVEEMTTENIDALWTPIVANERKKMEYFPTETSSMAVAGGGNISVPTSKGITIEPVQPMPMHTYEKIITSYDVLSEPSITASKREREETILGAFKDPKREVLSVLEESTESSSNALNIDNDINPEFIPHPPESTKSSSSAGGRGGRVNAARVASPTSTLHKQPHRTRAASK